MLALESHHEITDPTQLSRSILDILKKREASIHDGERRLVLAMLTDAVHDIARGARERVESLRWVESKAFDGCCAILELDVTNWRRILLLIPPRPRGRQLTHAQLEAIRRDPREDQAIADARGLKLVVVQRIKQHRYGRTRSAA